MNAAPPSLADARSLVASPLWPRMRAFLWQFETLCDESRLRSQVQTFARSQVPSSDPAVPPDGEPETDGDAAEPSNLRTFELANALATTPRVAASALHALGVEAAFHSFPAEDGSRLLLLSREDYDRLARFLGVVALAPALRRVTLGAEVRALRAAIPDYRETLAYAAYFHRFEALFERCSKRALRAFEDASGVVVKTPPTSFEGGFAAVVPEAERGEAASNAREAGLERAANPALGTPAEPGLNVVAAGHALLAAALSDLPPELLLRQRLRFPEGSPADAALAREASPDGRAPSRPDPTAAFAAAKLALKLSIPQEYTTCFS